MLLGEQEGILSNPSTLFNLRYLENIIRSCKSLMYVVQVLEYVWDHPQIHPLFT